MNYAASDPEDLYKALEAVDFDESCLIFDLDADAVFTSEEDYHDWQRDIGERCGCDHLISEHVDLDDNGYQVCTQCGLNPMFMCVLDRWGYGIHPADYEKVRHEPGPDAYRHVP